MPMTATGRSTEITVLCCEDVENLFILLGLGLDREADKVWWETITEDRFHKDSEGLEMGPGLEDLPKVGLCQTQNCCLE